MFISKTNWHENDIVMPEDLNRIEEGIKTGSGWKGTRAEYEAGRADGTIENGTVCYITDDDGMDGRITSAISRVVGESYAPISYMAFCANANVDSLNAAFGKGNEDRILFLGRQMAMYAWFKGDSRDEYPFQHLMGTTILTHALSSPYSYAEILSNQNIYNLMMSSPYAKNEVLQNYKDVESINAQGLAYISKIKNPTSYATFDQLLTIDNCNIINTIGNWKVANYINNSEFTSKALANNTNFTSSLMDGRIVSGQTTFERCMYYLPIYTTEFVKVRSNFLAIYNSPVGESLMSGINARTAIILSPLVVDGNDTNLYGTGLVGKTLVSGVKKRILTQYICNNPISVVSYTMSGGKTGNFTLSIIAGSSGMTRASNQFKLTSLDIKCVSYSDSDSGGGANVTSFARYIDCE